MNTYMISGGQVLTPDGPTRADVRIRADVIDAVGTDLAAEGATVVDATGCWVGPAFVDVHVHFREPGFEHKEDIASGSAAAAAGGFSAVVAMPNTIPAIDTPGAAAQITVRGTEVGLVEVMPAGCLTVGRHGMVLPDFSALWSAGVRVFSDDGDILADPDLLRSAMEQIAELGGVVSQHAVDPVLAAGGHMHDGTVAARHGVPGIPPAAEDTIIARDLALVRTTGCRYHLQHASTAGAVALVRDAKARGLPVTAEVTPHHLAFDHRDLETLDTSFKMMPPLRAPSDTEALRDGLKDGVFDVVATDHAPHAATEKAVAFVDAPNGVTGLEWSAAVVNTVIGLDMERFFQRMSVAPATVAGLARHGLFVADGAPANLVVFDPNTEVVARTTKSRSRNSPYLGKRWRGVVRATFYRGQRTHTHQDHRR